MVARASDSQNGQKRDQSPENAIVESIAAENLEDLAADSFEAVLDSLVADGPLKDIPIIGSVLKIYRAGADIREAMFVRKLIRFLYCLHDVPENDRRKFVRKMDADPELKQELGEKLIIVLDRLDDLKKADLVAAALRARMNEQITLKDFHALMVVIDRIILVYMDDYLQLYWLENPFVASYADRCDQLQTCDLFRRRPERGSGFGLIHHEKSDLSNLFFRFLVPFDKSAIRQDFLLTMKNMPITKPIDEAGYLEEKLNYERATTLINQLDDAAFMGLRLQQVQINQKDNEWCLRHLGELTFQKFWKTPGV